MKLSPLLLAVTIATAALLENTAWADRCPYCGEQYGSGPSYDAARIQSLRRAHEATCPARYEQVRRKLRNARQSHQKSTQKLRKATQTHRVWTVTLPDSNGLSSLRQQLREAVARNREMERLLSSLEREFDRLQAKLLAAHERNQDLLCVIEVADQDQAALEEELARVNRQWSDTRKVLDAVDKIAREQADLRRQAKADYDRICEPIADKAEQLSPRDLMGPIVLGQSRTDRSVVEVPATPIWDRGLQVPYAVAASVEQLSSASASGDAASSKPSGVQRVPTELAQMPLGDLNSRLSGELAEHKILLAETDGLREKAAQARDELAKALETIDRREVRRDLTQSRIHQLKNKLEWKRWEAQMHKDQIRYRLAEIAKNKLQTERWKALNRLLKIGLRDEAMEKSALAIIKMGWRLFVEDLDQVPYVLVFNRNPQAAAAVRELERLDAGLAEGFYNDAFGLDLKPKGYESEVGARLKKWFGK